MRVVSTKTTYLQSFTPPETSLPAPRPDILVQRIDRPAIDWYRDVYRGVGEGWNWVDRLMMADEQLAAILTDPRVDIFLLRAGEEPGGFAELDRRRAGEIEIAYFGLFPEHVGQGLGKFFLNWVLREAWRHQPRRVWVHTCDLDHPAALPNYLKAGLVVYDERIVRQPLPDPPDGPGAGGDGAGEVDDGGERL